MAERGKPVVACWDFDQTIGEFLGMRVRNPEVSQQITLRYGIRELLSEFSEEAGFRHVITSSANLGFITEGLNRTYLKKLFSGIYDNETVQQIPQGKHYRPVAKDLSYTEEDMQARMIAIGDSKSDKPVDIGGMVFVELGLPQAELDALVAREILTTMLDEGGGNFRDGYAKLYAKAEVVPTSQPIQRRRMALDPDISFFMEYRTANEVKVPKERRVPVIYDIRSASHTRPFQPFF